MPISIKCSACGRVFYHSGRIFPVSKALRGIDRCPICNKILNKDIRDIKIIIK